MTMLAEMVDAVIGIDTHRDTHEVEIADAAGKPIATMRISNDSAGFAQLLAAIAEAAPGPRVAVCIEGSRSYGIGLARALAAAGLLVIECEQPSRRQRRGKGKSDPIDAHLAVLAALRLDAGRLPVPRADGDREALRILLVRPAGDHRGPHRAGRPAACPAAGRGRHRPPAARTALTQAALAALAGRELPARRQPRAGRPPGRDPPPGTRAGQARQQLKDNRAQLLAIVDDIAPGLTSRYGVGPVSAAQAIVSFSHPGRCRSEAAFAALGGTSPIPASSGQTIRHRLNRGGDRALNRAIHAIALVRMRSCPRTRAYVARRTAEGKTPGKSAAASSATSPASSTATSPPPCPPPSRPAHEPAPPRARAISLHPCSAPGSVPGPRPLPGPALPTMGSPPHLPPTAEPARPTPPILQPNLPRHRTPPTPHVTTATRMCHRLTQEEEPPQTTLTHIEASSVIPLPR